MLTRQWNSSHEKRTKQKSEKQFHGIHVFSPSDYDDVVAYITITGLSREREKVCVKGKLERETKVKVWQHTRHYIYMRHYIYIGITRHNHFVWASKTTYIRVQKPPRDYFFVSFLWFFYSFVFPFCHLASCVHAGSSNSTYHKVLSVTCSGICRTSSLVLSFSLDIFPFHYDDSVFSCLFFSVCLRKSCMHGMLFLILCCCYIRRSKLWRTNTYRGFFEDPFGFRSGKWRSLKRRKNG